MEGTTGFEAVSSALVSGVTTIASNVGDMIADILPVALPVLGLSIAIFFGIKFIKKVIK